MGMAVLQLNFILKRRQVLGLADGGTVYCLPLSQWMEAQAWRSQERQAHPVFESVMLCGLR